MDFNENGRNLPHIYKLKIKSYVKYSIVCISEREKEHSQVY